MPHYRLEPRPQIEDVLKTLNEDEQEEVLRILGMLQVDPTVDGIHKTALPTKQGVLQCYNGQSVWVTYHMTDNTTVSVLNCGRYRLPPGPVM